MSRENSENSKESAKITKKLVHSNNTKKILHQLNENRRSNYQCDVSIVAQGSTFPAHRLVLSVAGGFFKALFASNMREQSENIVNLNEVDPEVMNDILSYIYTGEIELTLENAQLVIMAADFLLLDKLKISAEEFLAAGVFQDHFADNYFRMYQFAARYKCELLEEAALKLVRKNFEAFISDERFLELSAETLQEIISSDELVVTSEEVVFQAVVNWVKHKEERKASCKTLFSEIRRCSLSDEFCMSTTMLATLGTYCPDWFRSVKDGGSMIEQDGGGFIITLNWSQSHPRHCLDSHADAIIITPSMSYNDCKPWCYVPSENTWYHIAGIGSDFRRGYPFYYEGSVFLMADFCGFGYYVIVKYDMEINEWSDEERVYMDTFVSSPGVTIQNGTIYIVGGEKLMLDLDDDDFVSYDIPKHESLPDVYACDIKGTPYEVRKLAPLNTARSDPCIVADDKYIYVIGGHVSTHDNVHEINSVERYDPVSDSWTYLAPMPHFASGKHCTIASGKIFAFPVQRYENEGWYYYCNFDVYDICTDTWSEIPEPSLDLYMGVLTSFGDKLYLIGSEVDLGDLEDSTQAPLVLKTLSYDIKKELWSLCSSISLNTEKSQVSLEGTVVRLPKKFVSSLQKL